MPRLSELSPEQLRARRDAYLRRTYGLTYDDYERLLEAQQHGCWICHKTAEENGVRLAVDHNHKTGVVRGILCSYCNHRVVARHTDSTLLRRVADYLDQDTGFKAPDKKRVRKPRKARVRG